MSDKPNKQPIFDMETGQIKQSITPENVSKRIFYKINADQEKDSAKYFMTLVFSNGEYMNGEMPSEFIEAIKNEDPEEEITISGLAPSTKAKDFLDMFKEIPLDVLIEYGHVQKI